MSLWRLAIVAARFDPIVLACGALRELTSSEARATVQRMMAHRDTLRGLPTLQDRILTLGLTLHGVVPASDSVTIDDTMGWQMISLLMHAMAHGIP